MPRRAIAVLIPVLTLLAAGCATKGWVQKTLTNERAVTEQRVGEVERRVTDESGRISTIDTRLGDAGKRVETLDANLKTTGETAKAASEAARAAGEAAETARGASAAAQERADAAATKADEVGGRLTALWSNRHKRTVVDTMDVRFGFNRWELDDGAQTALLAIVEELKKKPELEIVLQGYTDGRGSRNYNIDLSRRRVEAVRRFLVERGVELWRVNGIGLGPVPAADVPDRQKRRVTVMVTLNE